MWAHSLASSHAARFVPRTNLCPVPPLFTNNFSFEWLYVIRGFGQLWKVFIQAYKLSSILNGTSKMIVYWSPLSVYTPSFKGMQTLFFKVTACYIEKKPLRTLEMLVYQWIWDFQLECWIFSYVCICMVSPSRWALTPIGGLYQVCVGGLVYYKFVKGHKQTGSSWSYAACRWMWNLLHLMAPPGQSSVEKPTNTCNKPLLKGCK